MMDQKLRIRSTQENATTRFDSTSIIIVSTWLLFLLPANLVVAPLGAIGQPALLVGFLGPVLWVYGKMFSPTDLDRSPNPVRWVLLTYLFYLVLNYALLQTRTQTELESTSSTRSVLLAFALVGVALLVCDGTTNRRRMDALVRAISYGAMAAALIAFVQFFLGIDLPARLPIPGLTFTQPGVDAIAERGGLNRPAGTMSHAIEMGVVMGATLPLAVHTARYLSRYQWIAWGGVAMIGAASMLSLSRSGILAAIAALAVLAIGWSWRQRGNGALAVVGLTAVMWAVVPGLISTLRWFFTNMGSEDSAQARIVRFPAVFDIVTERPWFGRGTGTFTVEEGLLLDQQLYQSLIELGIIGTLITLMMVIMGVVVGFSVWRRSGTRSESGHLALAFAGAVVALTLTGLMYTAFFYRVHFSLLLLSLGCLGYLWRFSRRHDVTENGTT